MATPTDDLKLKENATKDLKQEFEDFRSSVNEEIEKLKAININLEKEREHLQKNITILQRRIRKYNLIIYGFQGYGYDIWGDVIRLLRNTLQIYCNAGDFRSIYRFVKKEGIISPILIEVVHYELKVDILRSAKNRIDELQRLRIFFAHDLSPEDYERRQFPEKNVEAAKPASGEDVINGDALIKSEDTHEELEKSVEIDHEPTAALPQYTPSPLLSLVD